MTDVSERLKANHAKIHEQGFTAGKIWASTKSTLVQMRDLRRFVENQLANRMPLNPNNVANAVSGGIEEKWTRMNGKTVCELPDYPDHQTASTWVRGFCAGVFSVLSEVDGPVAIEV